MPFGRKGKGEDIPRPLTANAAIFGPDEGEKTYPCKHCGRKFVKNSLDKHQDACKKLQKPKRKPFESGAQRAGAGSDISMRDVQRVKKEILQNGGAWERPKTNWKARHEEFQESVKNARGVDNALKTGGPLPPPTRTKTPPDYIKCDYCGRSFNQQAAERHIPHCKKSNENKQLNAKPGGGGSKPPSGRRPSSRENRPSSRRDPSGGRRPNSRRGSAEPGDRRGQQGGRLGPQSATDSRRRGSADSRGKNSGGDRLKTSSSVRNGYSNSRRSGSRDGRR